MFTMEVEDTVLLDFANKLEAEYESLKNKIEKTVKQKCCKLDLSLNMKRLKSYTVLVYTRCFIIYFP